MTSATARITAVLAAGLIPLLPACAPAAEPYGAVVGLLIEDNGPNPGPHPLVPGHVTATGPAATQTVTASRNGQFRFSLPPGTYHLTARWGSARCDRAQPVRVRSGAITSDTDVTCSLP